MIPVGIVLIADFAATLALSFVQYEYMTCALLPLRAFALALTSIGAQHVHSIIVSSPTPGATSCPTIPLKKNYVTYIYLVVIITQIGESYPAFILL